MPDVFGGPRKEHFDIIDDLKSVVADVTAIRDDIGIKKFNVYFLKKTEGADDEWSQMLPTPFIDQADANIELLETGSVQKGDIFLRGIPIASYTQDELDTATTDEDVSKYIVMDGKAYTVVRITRELLTYDIHLRRFESINEGELVIPPEEDMGLTQEQVDARIRALATQTNHLFEAEMSLPATQIDEDTEQKVNITARHGVTDKG